MAYSERLLESQERLSMRDMRLRVAKLILRGVASSTIAQAEGYPSYTARELSSYFSYSSISISSKPEPELLLLFQAEGCAEAREKKFFFHVGRVRDLLQSNG